jgi:hypothetical protein
MPQNDEMNEWIRTSRSSPSFDLTATSDDINRAIRRAAGHQVPAPAQQQDQAEPTRGSRGASGRLLAEATQAIRDNEPIPGLHSDRKWQEWAWSRGVITVMDQQGRLPGERGFRSSMTGEALQTDFDPVAAIDSRRERWKGRI